MWLWRRVCGEPLESEIRAILALTMSRRSGGRLAPYTSSDVARFTNMLLSLWLSPWGKLIDLEVFVPSVPLLSLKGIHLAVFTAQTRLALRALVDDAGAWDAAWQWRQGGRRVPIAPSCLATRVIAKATPTVWNKAVSTLLAQVGHRSAAIVTQRDVRHARSPCAGAVPACV